MRNQRLPPTTTCSSSNKNTMQEEPHLSGAYIRRLVKHLSSSSTTRSNDHHHIPPMGSKPQQQEQQAATQTPAPAPPKKQVRRRLHTSRPYQERLLNMAEARREIVTALKIHRASMRQAKEQQQQEQLVQQLQHQQDVQLVQEQFKQSAAWSASMGSSNGSSLSDYLHDSSPSLDFTATSSSYPYYYSSPILPYHTPPLAAPVVPMLDGPLDHLPAQPLGLNLSFHGFGGAIAGEDDKNDPAGSFHPPPLLQASPASSYSVYSSPPPATTMASQDMSSAVTSAEDTSLHRVLDDEEMAAICSAGEQHDTEWSDTVNLVTSAWWSTLLESVEGSGDAAVAQQAKAGDAQLGMHRSDQYYGHDVSSLPRMDIGEMDGWDAEWFS
uniref:Uncharacterized protein n=1 Tax=Avena sativa TaxID=4498 RepID=A0ACD6AAA4_AVESA